MSRVIWGRTDSVEDAMAQMGTTTQNTVMMSSKWVESRNNEIDEETMRKEALSYNKQCGYIAQVNVGVSRNEEGSRKGKRTRGPSDTQKSVFIYAALCISPSSKIHTKETHDSSAEAALREMALPFQRPTMSSESMGVFEGGGAASA